MVSEPLRKVTRLVRDLARGRAAPALWLLLDSIALSGFVLCFLSSVIVASPYGFVNRRPVKAVDGSGPLLDGPSEADILWNDAVGQLVDQAQFVLQSNTADAWIERLSMPVAVFDALDAFLGALEPAAAAAGAGVRREWRETWLRHAIENWHNSPEYQDDAGIPMVSLADGRLAARRRLDDVIADSRRGPEVANRLIGLSRLEWLMAVARDSASAANSFNLPAGEVQDALDAYFGLDGAGSATAPLYPDLHLVSETVLRASVATCRYDRPDTVSWAYGMPAPVRAALDALR